MPQELPLREAYGQTLVDLGRENPDIVVLDADLSSSTMTHFFAKEFPNRFFDCGVAEQNMVSIAAGLAASGKIPFASTFAVFAPGRCFDQIRMSIAQPGLNVKLVATHGGISVGEDGISHQSIEDLSLICSLPGFTVIVPADAIETAQAVRAAAASFGPFYIRLCRPKVPLVYGDDYRFNLGKAVTMRQGGDVTIIAIGILVAAALEAADDLKREGVDCRVVNMPTLKPIDEEAIIKAAADTGAIVTVEEHLEHGGLGSTVARVVARHRPVPMEFVAIKDTYATSGKADELLQRYGLTAKDIGQAVRGVLKRSG
ncbi:MAG: transketolase family protein [Chloroflexi bacterium]|nr:transketolase family protein [Chloroflexota bacterium]MBI3040271.1 transketolase family protein [Chloroflexota bacterium]